MQRSNEDFTKLANDEPLLAADLFNLMMIGVKRADRLDSNGQQWMDHYMKNIVYCGYESGCTSDGFDEFYEFLKGRNFQVDQCILFYGGLMMYDQGEYQNAYEFLMLSRGHTPEMDIEAPTVMIGCLAGMGRVAEARKAFNDLLATTPDPSIPMVRYINIDIVRAENPDNPEMTLQIARDEFKKKPKRILLKQLLVELLRNGREQEAADLLVGQLGPKWRNCPMYRPFWDKVKHLAPAQEEQLPKSLLEL